MERQPENSEPRRGLRWPGLWYDAWRHLSRFQKQLVLGNAAYVVLLLVYVFAWRADVLKYAIVLCGVTLAATIPELASKKRLVLRLTLLCVPAVAIALVQILSDRESDTRQFALSQQVATLELAKFRDVVRAAEIRAREEIRLDPRDTVEAIQNANRGFLIRADMLALHAAARQAGLAAASPDLASRLPPASADPPSRLQAYKTLANDAGSLAVPRPPSRAGLDDLIALTEMEVGYRDLAQAFTDQIRPAYAEFLSQYTAGRTFEEMRAGLWTLYQRTRALADRYDLAGLNNNLGLLAMAAGHPEEALSRFYRGYELDHEHLPIYESLGYALWSVNNDADGAFRFAALGCAAADSLRARLTAELDALPVTQRQSYAALVPKLNAFVDAMTVRLKLQYAYFAALDIQSEQVARAAQRYARELYEANRNDAEYQDALGFVLMRFGGPPELDEAKTLFEAAIGNPSAERMTSRLAAQHAAELQMLRRTLKIPAR